jgi:hypothetical protein
MGVLKHNGTESGIRKGGKEITTEAQRHREIWGWGNGGMQERSPEGEQVMR